MSIGILERAASFGERVAVHDDRGAHSYARLLAVASGVAGRLSRDRGEIEGERVAFLLPPGAAWVSAQWGIWRAGGTAVPLAPSHPAPELGKILADARPAALLVDAGLVGRAREAVAVAAAATRAAAGEAEERAPIDIVSFDPTRPPAIDIDAADEAGEGGHEDEDRSPRRDGLPPIGPGRDAMMVYTSGTTGRPKGVVSTHANVEAQITTLVEAWAWSDTDQILHVLPLHHVHGIINALCCALWSGAACRFCPPEPARIWEEMAAGRATVFMAVPTIYRRLLDAWDAADGETRERWSSRAGRLRLMVSGSAALPVATFARWQQVTGHALLERYGMTEIGMALGNPLRGERRPGTVGQPLPGVEARIVDEGGEVTGEGREGEIQVRGPQVFRQYWRRPDETRAAFTDDGWFRTGDEAVIEDGYWRIVGRRGVDIIKSGGYKISALEIEAVLREHPAIDDAAVVGVDDAEWGERVCAAVVEAVRGTASEEEMRAWCKARLAPYKVPKQIASVVRLPRNALGKVTKQELRPIFYEPQA